MTHSGSKTQNSLPGQVLASGQLEREAQHSPPNLAELTTVASVCYIYISSIKNTSRSTWHLRSSRTGWHKQQKLIFSRSWRLDVPDQGAVRLVPGEASPPGGQTAALPLRPHTAWSFLCVCRERGVWCLLLFLEGHLSCRIRAPSL